MALESYITVFDEESALDRFEAFASVNGASFYGLPLNDGTVTLRKVATYVPDNIPLPNGESVYPFMGGGELPWCLDGR